MKVLITGANGFLGKNLLLHLAERRDVEAVCFTRQHDAAQLRSLLRGVDFVFHLAGVNRPDDPQAFIIGNVELTGTLCAAIAGCGQKVRVVYASSTQAALDNPYGTSKRRAENLLFDLQRAHGTPVHVFRLTNVFGKWCRPNYNSVVATFCNNVARDLPIQLNEQNALLRLVYVDDVVERFIQLVDGADGAADGEGFETITPQYTIALGDLALQIQAFRESRLTLLTERVGVGLTRALYSTYVSYLPTSSFVYDVPQHGDARGVFVEMLKTPDCGQFSYFTAQPGVTRGGHYHHSKTEKFLVIKGQARFRFRHLNTGEIFELITSGDRAEIVETVPGWTHDITNIGDQETIVMLWANEVFDRSKPDTYACPL
jgi:UDP-2-acetamido-2,6-beta-L-arabino-hexul-4-ose reductase